MYTRHAGDVDPVCQFCHGNWQGTPSIAMKAAPGPFSLCAMMSEVLLLSVSEVLCILYFVRLSF